MQRLTPRCFGFDTVFLLLILGLPPGCAHGAGVVVVGDTKVGPPVQTNAPELRLVLTMTSNVFTLGDPLILRIGVTNSSEQPWFLGKNARSWSSIRAQLIEPANYLRSGKPVRDLPLTLYGERFMAAAHADWLLFAGGTVRAGRQASEDVPMARVFDFSLSGKFMVEVQVSLTKPGQVCTMSNSITFTVRAPGADFGWPLPTQW